jgi:hypothetical protein
MPRVARSSFRQEYRSVLQLVFFIDKKKLWVSLVREILLGSLT